MQVEILGDAFSHLASTMATVISETENCLQETALPRASVAPPSPRLGRLEVLALFLLSFPVLLSSYRGWWPISVAEAWGFATGGICVWLVVRQHMANWPIGLANNVFFFVLFYQGRIFADMGLPFRITGIATPHSWDQSIFPSTNPEGACRFQGPPSERIPTQTGILWNRAFGPGLPNACASSEQSPPVQPPLRGHWQSTLKPPG